MPTIQSCGLAIRRVSVIHSEHTHAHTNAHQHTKYKLTEASSYIESDCACHTACWRTRCDFRLTGAPEREREIKRGVAIAQTRMKKGGGPEGGRIIITGCFSMACDMSDLI